MRCLHVSALASFRRLLVVQLSVLQAQGMYAGITSVGASVGSETSNRLPFYRLARKTESYSKAFVFIIAVTEVGCSDGVCARSDPVIGFEKRRVRPRDRLNITYLAHKRSVLFGFTAPRA